MEMLSVGSDGNISKNTFTSHVARIVNVNASFQRGAGNGREISGAQLTADSSKRHTQRQFSSQAVLTPKAGMDRQTSTIFGDQSVR